MKKLFLILAVLWMAVIFLFSARNAEESTEDSHRAGRIAAELLMPGFSEMTEAEQEQIIGYLDHPVRKTAHFIEYMVLGFLLAGSFGLFLPGAPEQIKEELRRKGLRAWAAGTVYAVTDEVHQIFVPGRACMLSDAALDSAGVLAGLFLAFLCLILFSGSAVRRSLFHAPV